MKLFPQIVFIFFSLSLCGQEIFGVWKSSDRSSGNDQALIKIYSEDNKIYAKIIEAIDPDLKNYICLKCKGENKDKPMEGMIILKELIPSSDKTKFHKGFALNPFNGKYYKCDATFINKDLIRVRGFIGISLFGKSEYWQRVK